MTEPQTNPRISRFNFSGLRDFGEPFQATPLPPEPEMEMAAPAPPPPPVFSEEERETARAEGYAEGRAKGIEEGRKQKHDEAEQRNETLKAAIASLTGQAEALQAAFDDVYSSYRRDTVTLAVAVAKHVCSTLFETEPVAMFESLVERALPTLLRQPKITATVHPGIEKNARETLESVCEHAGYQGEVEVKTSERLGPQDARLAWAEGRAEVNMEEVWRTIETMFEGRAPKKKASPKIEEAAPIANEGDVTHG